MRTKIFNSSCADALTIYKKALASDADVFLFVAEHIVLPENAEENLSKQLNKNIHCVSGWVKRKGSSWNALRLVGDSTVDSLKEPSKHLTRVDYTTFECLMVTRELLSKVTFKDNRELELQDLNGFKAPLMVDKDFCNQVYDLGYEIFMSGDVICDVMPLHLQEDIQDPPRNPSDSKEINVLFASDDNYAMPLGVALKSLVDNYKDARKLRVIVADTGISYENKAKLLNIYPVEFLDVPLDAIKNLKIHANYHSVSVYARLLAPNLLNLQKLLYLDCDILVKGDIGELWDIDNSDYAISAVADFDYDGRYFYRYFNSGVMLINVIRWREEKITERTIEYAENNHCKFVDQDALNGVLEGNWLPISARWNRNQYIEGTQDTRIVHFLGVGKPWFYGYELDHQEDFYETLDKTDWNGWRAKQPNLKAVFI